MNIENKFNVGDKVFICGNLDKLKEYFNIEPLLAYGELRKPFRDILNNNIKENVKIDIIEALKIKETEITKINIYVVGKNKPAIMYRVGYDVYPYELEENKIYHTKEEVLAVVEAEIKKVFKENRDIITEKINNVENQIFEFHETVNKH